MKIAAKPLLQLPDAALREGRVGLVCNQTSWDFSEGRYLFEQLHRRGQLHRVFTPEHGLFAELQDQEALPPGGFYQCLDLDGVDFVSLYGSSEASLSAPAGKLQGLDAIVIDLQDVGCRYYTFISTVDKLFRSLTEYGLSPAVYVIDRPNPAGRQVEGTPLPREYASFIGVEGLPHRHGLTFGELCGFLHTRQGAQFPLWVIPWTLDARYAAPLLLPSAGSSFVKTPCAIYPSPNIPSPYTCLVYSGQCLFEGANVSEGRGTTRPFEIFGAPFLSPLYAYNRAHGYGDGWNDPRHPLYDEGALLRLLHFIPTFHKYSGEICYGFQLHLTGKSYHSLRHSLRLLRFLSGFDGFAWRAGVYEKGNDKTAIELLAGDALLLDYLHGKASDREINQALEDSEEAWRRERKEYMIY